MILFPPVGFNAPASLIINGLPTTWGNPLPWKNTAETPNLVGKNDSTDDMRPGLGWDGLAKLQEFVAKGGVLLTATDTSNFAISSGFENGVTLNQAQKLKIVGRCWARDLWMARARSLTGTARKFRSIATTDRSFR